MKKTSLLLLLGLSFQILSGQIVSVDYILGEGIKKIDSLSLKDLKFYHTPLSLGFNEFKITDTTTIDQLKEKTIFKIELYYSSYKDSPKFSQINLNRNRLIELQKHLPEAFENNAIEWGFVEQVENKDKPKAEKLFHGFLFYSREAIMKSENGELIKMGTPEEIAFLKNVLGLPLDDKDTSSLPIPTVETCDTLFDVAPRYGQIINFSGKYWPRSKRRRAKGILYDKASIWKRKKRDTIQKVFIHLDTTTTINCNGKRFTYSISGRMAAFEFDPITSYAMTVDSVVMKTLTENEWPNTTIVEDVTGSMYPYIGQTLLWKRLNKALTPIDDFVFFNDGDRFPDGPIGKSGGAYSVHSTKIRKIEKTAFTTMAKGSGGAGPENDVEAMLRAYDFFNGGMKRILLIADNWAPVRDLSILSKLLNKKIPIDIIVCGAWEGRINSQYLEIARKTGGSIFTMEAQIHTLSLLAEGETISIGSQKFILRKGKLELTR